jgi:hypothetical protein
MELNVIKKETTKNVRYLVTEFGEIELYDAYEVLTEGLGDSSYSSPTVLHDSNMGKWFESLGVVFKGTRGSYYVRDIEREKYDELVEKLRNIVYAES